MSKFISKQTVEELTGKKLPKAQVKVLRELGFVVLWVPGQYPKVTVEHFAKMTGGGVELDKDPEVKLHLNEI